MNAKRPPATPPPAAPGPGTGMDERDLWTTEPESLTIRQLNKAVRALREAVHEEKVRAQQAEAERDEARTHVRRLSTVISTQKEMDAKHMELCDRAEAAEASLLALRNGVRQPLADAEEQLRIFRASLGGPDAPACNKLNRAIEGVAKVRAALGGDASPGLGSGEDGTGTGGAR